MMLTIDPGLRHCGCALWNLDGTLYTAKLVKNLERKARGPAAHFDMACAVDDWFTSAISMDNDYYTRSLHKLVVEFPRVYPNHSNKRAEDPNDLLELAGVLGAIATRFCVRPKHYFPSDWKGQVPKKIMTERISCRLTRDELERLVTTDHNTLDAVGIGLFHLGRL